MGSTQPLDDRSIDPPIHLTPKGIDSAKVIPVVPAPPARKSIDGAWGPGRGDPWLPGLVAAIRWPGAPTRVQNRGRATDAGPSTISRLGEAFPGVAGDSHATLCACGGQPKHSRPIDNTRTNQKKSKHLLACPLGTCGVSWEEAERERLRRRREDRSDALAFVC